MRYTVHIHRTFHHRITKYLGVLVGAALVSTLGLPSAVQAQTPAAPTVIAETGTDGSVLAVSWGQPLSDSGEDPQTHWLLEYTEPGVAWAKATKVALAVSAMMSDPLPANDPRIHHGVWRFRVSYYIEDTDLTMDGHQGKVIGDESDITDYLHGPPATAPTGFAAYPAGPDARRLVWDKVTGAASYELRYSSDPTDDDEWEGWDPAMSGDVIDDLDLGEVYTFELRALGASRAGIGDLHGPSASIDEKMPIPTPTLPESALLLLAMLLLGSGVYLLRDRQSGGLTHA